MGNGTLPHFREVPHGNLFVTRKYDTFCCDLQTSVLNRLRRPVQVSRLAILRHMRTGLWCRRTHGSAGVAFWKSVLILQCLILCRRKTRVVDGKIISSIIFKFSLLRKGSDCGGMKEERWMRIRSPGLWYAGRTVRETVRLGLERSELQGRLSRRALCRQYPEPGQVACDRSDVVDPASLILIGRIFIPSTSSPSIRKSPSTYFLGFCITQSNPSWS